MQITFDRGGNSVRDVKIHRCTGIYVKTYKLQFVISCERMTISLDCVLRVKIVVRWQE